MLETPDFSSVHSFKLVTYKCKHMETSKHAIEQLSKLANIILLQQHWYSDCQLGNLTMVCDSLTGVGKSVDTRDPILPLRVL